MFFIDLVDLEHASVPFEPGNDRNLQGESDIISKPLHQADTTPQDKRISYRN